MVRPATAMAVAGNRTVGLLLLVALAVCALLQPCNAASLRTEEEAAKEPTAARRQPPPAAATTATLIEQQQYYEQGGQQRIMQDLQPQLSISEASGMELSVFPSVEESTILFLHVYKCAGTSLRQVFLEWARSEGWTGAVVTECRDIRQANERRICLDSQNDIMDLAREKWLLRGQKTLVGHFFWDFRHYVLEPYLMITTLRNPLELFVSSLQFKNREQTRTLAGATQLATLSMQTALSRRGPAEIGYVRRFLDQDAANDYRTYRDYAPEEYAAMVSSAVNHLNTFWVVGVVEQYEGFLEVLEACFDPHSTNPALWRKAHLVASNGSPVHSSEVVASVNPDLIKEFNTSVLSPQWQFYDVALQLWDSRCREVLPDEKHDRFCSVTLH